jgi:TPR repeat protein
MYSDGKGVRRDLIKAYMWVAVAGSGKHPDAQAALETLTANMNKRQNICGPSPCSKMEAGTPARS